MAAHSMDAARRPKAMCKVRHNDLACAWCTESQQVVYYSIAALAVRWGCMAGVCLSDLSTHCLHHPYLVPLGQRCCIPPPQPSPAPAPAPAPPPLFSVLLLLLLLLPPPSRQAVAPLWRARCVQGRCGTLVMVTLMSRWVWRGGVSGVQDVLAQQHAGTGKG